MKNTIILLTFTNSCGQFFFCSICKLILELYLYIYETLYLRYVRMSLHSHRHNAFEAGWIRFSAHSVFTKQRTK